MILAEDRGNYHFIKYDVLPMVEYFSNRIRSIFAGEKYSHYIYSDQLFIHVQNHIAQIACRFGYWKPTNTNDAFGKKYGNRHLIGHALIYALYKPLYYFLLNRNLFPNMNASGDASQIRVEGQVLMTEPIYKSRPQTMKVEARAYWDYVLPPELGYLYPNRLPFLRALFLNYLYDKKKTLQNVPTMSIRADAYFEYTNVLRRIYDFLQVQAEMGQETEGYKQFLYYTLKPARRTPTVLGGDKEYSYKNISWDYINKNEQTAIRAYFDKQWNAWQKQDFIKFWSDDLADRLSKQSAKNSRLVIDK